MATTVQQEVLPTFTTESLFQLVTREIDRRITPQEIRVLRGIISGGGSVSTKDLAQVADTIQKAIAEGIKPRIISGLDVTETTPPSQSVIVALGKGFVAGKFVELTENRTLAIPTDDSAQVFYINLDRGDGLTVDRTKFSDRLSLARIVIPRPGITSIILDDKPAEPTAIEGWIVSGKDAVFDADQKFDEDSIEALKRAISPILGETIVGTLKLSEQLKILSLLGTVEIDAQEIRIKYANGIVGARLSKQGTFFFDENGLERARFTATDAAIGNAVTINTDGLSIIGPNGLTIVTGGEIRVSGGGGISTLIDSKKIFIGQSASGQGINLANADGTHIYIDINGVNGEFIHPDSIETRAIKAKAITTDLLNANAVTADKINTREITADKFNTTLFGDLNQAIRYVKKALNVNPESTKTLAQSDLDAGTATSINTTDATLRLKPVTSWDDGSTWDSGKSWDIPVASTGNWISANQDAGSSITGQITVSAQVTETSPAATSVTAGAQYSTDNVNFGSNSPTFNDNIYESLTETASGGASNFSGSIFTFRYYKIKITLTTLDTNHNIILGVVQFKIDQVNLVAFQRNQAIAVGGTAITYSGFNAVPAIAAIASGAGLSLSLELNARPTTSSTTLRITNRSGVEVPGMIDSFMVLGA